MTGPSVRLAEPSDAESIARIYNHYVVSSTATFDIEPKSVAERTEWIARHGESHPVFVAELAGEVVGWASLSEFRERPAYCHTVETAVYVESSHTGRGIGPVLLDALMNAAAAAGHHAVISQVVAGNDASIKLATRAGFEVVGTLPEVGRKFDRWLDVVIMERRL